MWDFQPSLRHRIFSALGDFSENQKEKLSRVKEEVAIFSVKKLGGKLNMSDGRSTPGSGISVRSFFSTIEQRRNNAWMVL